MLIKNILKIITVGVVMASTSFSADSNLPCVKINNKKLSRINPNIFGHFMERPSWHGEFGIEHAVLDDTGKIDQRVIDKLLKMNIPLLRFPGGTDLELMDWTDMIDMPERKHRPLSEGRLGDKVTNRFGYDEFFPIAEKCGAEKIIVLNFEDAFLKRKDPKDAALHSAGLLAYCNATTGQKLPEGMKDWPQIRKKNGREEPYNAEYVQVGNEVWFYWTSKKDTVLHQLEIEDPNQWYVDCFAVYLDIIDQIDPDIKVIADYINEDIFNKMHEKFGSRIDYYVYHHYNPWAMSKETVKKDGQPYPIEKITKKQAWNGWVSAPAVFNENGMSNSRQHLRKLAIENDVNIAVTEWNWNGWWVCDDHLKPLDSTYAKALGCAGFLNGFIRNSDFIKMACQSMLVGSTWGITGIRVDKSGEKPPYYMPTSQVVSFYAENCGDYYLNAEFENIPTYNQPVKMGGILPNEKVATLDIIPTSDDSSLSVFILNRDFMRGHSLKIDLTDFDVNYKSAKCVTISGAVDDCSIDPWNKPYLSFEQSEIDLNENVVNVNLSARTLSVVKINR